MHTQPRSLVASNVLMGAGFVPKRQQQARPARNLYPADGSHPVQVVTGVNIELRARPGTLECGSRAVVLRHRQPEVRAPTFEHKSAGFNPRDEQRHSVHLYGNELVPMDLDQFCDFSGIHGALMAQAMPVDIASPSCLHSSLVAVGFVAPLCNGGPHYQLGRQIARCPVLFETLI